MLKKTTWKTIAANPRRSIWEKCLNHFLIANSESTQKDVWNRIGIIDLGAFCVELWPKQVLHRISVPMSYISFFYFSYIVSFVVKSPSGGKNP